MDRTRKAAIYSILTEYSVQIINFISVIVFARLLTPAEIGTFAVAGSISMLAGELRSLGVVQFIIREEELTREKLQSALGMIVSFSFSLGLIMIVCAPFISDFYDEESLQTILWLMSPTFFISPMTSIPIALLMREMEFTKLYVVWTTGAVVSFASTLWLVLAGYSYYGLAGGVIIGLVAELLICIWHNPAGTVWVPRFSWLRGLLRFGLFSTATSMFDRFSEGLPDLIIGRFGTMADVGLFSRGLGAILFLNRIVVQAVSSVVLPHFATVKRGGDQLREAYLNAIKLQAAFNWPVFAVVSVAAYPLIMFLFGDQWGMAAPITSALAYWAMLTSIHCFSNQILVVTGNESWMFYSALVSFVARLTAVLIAAPYGLMAVAWAMVASGAVDFAAHMVAVRKAVGLGFWELVRAFVPNFLVAAMCWLAAWGIGQWQPFETTAPWLSLLTIAGFLTVTWLVGLKVTRNPAWEIVMSFVRPRLARGI